MVMARFVVVVNYWQFLAFIGMSFVLLCCGAFRVHSKKGTRKSARNLHASYTPLTCHLHATYKQTPFAGKFSGKFSGKLFVEEGHVFGFLLLDDGDVWAHGFV